MREESHAATPVAPLGDMTGPSPAEPPPGLPTHYVPTTRLPVRERAEAGPAEARGELGQLLAAATALPPLEQEAFALLVLRALPPESIAAALAVVAQHLPPAAQQHLRRVLPAPALPLEAPPWRILLGTLLGVVAISAAATIVLLARRNPGAGYALALGLAALGLLAGLLLAALPRQA